MLDARVLGLIVVVAVVSACAETPTEPLPLDSDLFAAANAPSQGGPIVNHVPVDVAFVFPCATFDVQVVVVGKQVVQTWFYPGGGVRRVKLHINQDATFTNLSSGVSATNNSTHNIEARFDESGNMTYLAVNGAQQKIHDFDGGALLFFHIGHEVINIDFSTSPPTVDVTFSGHSNLAEQSGPCAALGDPA